jgi:hypothetical protein
VRRILEALRFSLLRGCKGTDATEMTEDVEVWQGLTDKVDVSVVVDTLLMVE